MGQPELLKFALSRQIRRMGCRKEIESAQVIANWKEVVGPQVAARASVESLSHGKLTLVVPEAAWEKELDLSRDDLIKNILLLQDANELWKKTVDRLTALVSLPKEEVIAVMDQLCVIKRRYFGRSSEKRPDPKDIEHQARKSRKRGKKVLLPSMRYPDIGLVEEEQDFEGNHKPHCSHCDKPLEKMKETENSEVITVTQKIFHIVRKNI